MRPLEGRRIWFVGIGGAGLSAYAQLARAWGAEVGGWDRVDTPYLEPLRDARLEIGPEPVTPEGWEVVVSSAYPATPGRRRGDFLTELVGLRRSIVVAGSHGKGTTAAMIAFVLRETGRDPAWLIGAPVPQLGSNAGAGDGWLVVEGDESDRSVFTLPAEIAVVTNVELDHHAEFRSLAELEAEFARWAATRCRTSCGTRRRTRAGWRCRASTIAATRAPRSPRSSLPACRRDEAAPVLARFTGTGRRFEVRRGRRRDDRRRLRPPSDRGGRDDPGRARALSGPPPSRALSAAPVFAHATPCP